MEERAPGYRFYPTEEELVSFYLHNKLQGQRLEMHRIIPVVSIYDIEPWHLPSTCLDPNSDRCLCSPSLILILIQSIL